MSATVVGFASSERCNCSSITLSGGSNSARAATRFSGGALAELAHEIGKVAGRVDTGAVEPLGGHIELQGRRIHRGDVIGIARRIDAAGRIEQRQQEFGRMFDDRQLLVLVRRARGC